MAKVRAFLIIVIGVFIATAGPVFLGNVTNVFHTQWSTWETILTAGVFGIVTWLLATVVPVAIKPSLGLRFPEA
jgi:hypothetical protein